MWSHFCKAHSQTQTRDIPEWWNFSVLFTIFLIIEISYNISNDTYGVYYYSIAVKRMWHLSLDRIV